MVAKIHDGNGQSCWHTWHRKNAEMQYLTAFYNFLNSIDVRPKNVGLPNYAVILCEIVTHICEKIFYKMPINIAMLLRMPFLFHPTFWSNLSTSFPQLDSPRSNFGTLQKKKKYIGAGCVAMPLHCNLNLLALYHNSYIVKVRRKGFE